MKFAVLGQPCIDEIIAHDGSMKGTALGGILYSLAATERLLREFSPSDSFTALVWNSRPDKPLLDPLYSKFSRLDREHGLWPTDELSNRVQLRYSSTSDRTEHCSSILPPLSRLELGDFELSESDGIFVNMISGFDVDLETFEWIRQNAPKAHIHLDVHALSLGSLSDSQGGAFGTDRKIGPLKDWQRWFSAADSVQLNEAEAVAIGAPKYAGEEALVEETRALDRRPKTLIVTRAERGATVFNLHANFSEEVSAPKVEARDTTGSGDVFGAVFSVLAAKRVLLQEAASIATKWASWNTELDSIDALLSSPLPKFIAAQT